MLTKDHSFEPRVGTAQFVFGILYTLIALSALMLAMAAMKTGNDPKIQFFMLTLFLVLAIKSFFIFFRVKKLIREGIRVNATFTSCDAVRGITIVKATYDVKDYGPIEIQTRLAGETVSHEIKRYLENKPKLVPALIVGSNSKHPRGMLLIRTVSGHLDENTIKIQ